MTRTDDKTTPGPGQHRRRSEVGDVDEGERLAADPTFVVALAALVVAIAALVVAASGMATASPKVIVRRGDIAPGAVTGKALAEQCSAAKIKKNAITAPKLAKASRDLAGDLRRRRHRLRDRARLGGRDPVRQRGSCDQVDRRQRQGGPQRRMDRLQHRKRRMWIRRQAARGRLRLREPEQRRNDLAPGDACGQRQFQGFVGRFSSDAGGTASGEVVADCLEK
ncbi:MAG: hypothetical protein QM729_13110 [Solirubrobacterales bacterium]